MKKFCIFIFAFSLLIIADSTYAQETFGQGGLLPVNPSRSVVFGYDIYVSDQPIQNQQKAAMCSAFNGWLYSAFSYFDENGMAHITIYRSTDAGHSWMQFFDAGLGTYHKIFQKIDIAAGGTNTENLKIFLGGMYCDTATYGGQLVVDRINGISGEHEAYMIANHGGKLTDFAISTDYPNTANNSDPFSFGVVYGYNSNGSTDSVVFYSSSDGGITLNQRQVLATGITYFHKMDLSYGYSPSENSGRYFATWEEQTEQFTELGHIYTSHSEPDFNSPFTSPVCLDCTEIDLVNKCRNPVISCISGGADNDSLNITELIMFENFNTGGNYDITGFYNRKAVSTLIFYRMNFVQSAGNEFQPDICYNPFDSSFIVSYYNQQNQKLPYEVNDHCLTNPNNWTLITQGYNDTPNLSIPEPKVFVNNEKQTGAAVWCAERPSGNGVVMYDAEYIYYTGLSESTRLTSISLFNIYPNPFTSLVSIEFESKAIQKINITLYDLLGKPVHEFCDQQFVDGHHKLESDLSGLSSGSYFCILRCGNVILSSKIVLKH